MTEDKSRYVNPYAMASLFCAALLLFPIGAVLAAIGLYQTWRQKKGGTILAVLGILVNAVFLPGAVMLIFFGHPGDGINGCLRTQDGAVGVLRLIAFLEADYKKTHGRYGSLEEIPWKPKVSLRPYTYKVVHAGKDNFRATAVGADRMEGDSLVIDQSNKVERLVDVCKR